VATKPPLRHEEVQRVLRQLGPLTDDRSIVLIGGQAVAFWMRFLSAQSEELDGMDPLTSKDIDFEGSSRAVKRAADLLAGRMKLAGLDDHTPHAGLVMFEDSEGVGRVIDFIDAPLGLSARDVRDTAVQLEVPDSSGRGQNVRIWLMHPERSMESRVINTIELGKTGALALRQLSVSVVCARLWSRYLLDADDVPMDQRVRAVLRINERIFRKCLKDKRFRDVVIDHGVNPFDAVLVDDPRLPERLRARRYPQMRELLDERLKRDHENRARAARRRGAVPRGER
jgi:hypothetical protein